MSSSGITSTRSTVASANCPSRSRVRHPPSPRHRSSPAAARSRSAAAAEAAEAGAARSCRRAALAASPRPHRQPMLLGRSPGRPIFARPWRSWRDSADSRSGSLARSCARRRRDGARSTKADGPTSSCRAGVGFCGRRIFLPDDSEPAIRVADLRKTFNVPVREAGLGAAIRSLVRRESREVRAVDDIGFEIAPGEIVGFLGPNGAGKTTTLKMLSGLLYPTSGEARVLGHVPSKREREFLSRITLVMGHRNQLQWDLPALDSFELNRAIYRIARPEFMQLRDELIELLDVGDLVRKPVRNISLGERMKVEVVGSLLHRPQVLFLDEPTIGLDVTMQKRIRSFIAEYNRRY